MAGAHRVGGAYVTVAPVFTDFNKQASRKGQEAAEEFRKGWAAGMGGEDPDLPGGKDAEKQSEEDGSKAGGAYAKAFHGAVSKMKSSITPLDLDVDDDEAKAKLESIHERLDALKDATVGVDLKDGDARRELKTLQAELEVLSSKSVNVQVRVDSGRAAAEAAAALAAFDKFDAQSETRSREAGAKSGGAYTAAFRDSLNRMQDSLGSLTVGVDDSKAKAKLDSIRAEIAAMRDVNVGVDVDAATAEGKLRKVANDLRMLSENSASVTVRANTGKALADLVALDAALSKIDAKHVSITVDDNGIVGLGDRLRAAASEFDSAGFASMGAASQMGLLAAAAGALVSALIPVTGAAIGVAGGLAQMGAGAVAGAGVFALAIRPVLETYKALGQADKSNAQSATSNAQAVTNARRQVANAERAVSDARMSAAAAVEAASRREQAAQRGLIQAQREAVTAQRALTQARQEAIDQMARLSQDATDAALNQRQAALDVQRAKEALSETRSKGGDGASPLEREQAALAVEKARAALAEKRAAANKTTTVGSAASDLERQKAALAVEKARAALLEKQAAAKKTTVVGSAASDLERQRAALAVEKARATLAEKRERAKRGKADAFDVKGAELALREAEERQRRLAGKQPVLKAPTVDAFDVKAAELALREAEERQRKLAAKKPSVKGSGVDALDVKSAELALREAEERQRKLAAKGGGGATGTEMAQAQLDFEQALNNKKKADKAAADAKKASAEAQRAGVTGSEVYQRALDGVVKANDKVAQQRIEVTEAHKAVAEAQQNGARRIQQAQQQLADAQNAVANAGKRVSAGMSNVQQSMQNLGPEGKKLVTMLRDATDWMNRLAIASQERMFPGLIDAIHTLSPIVPGFERLVLRLSDTMGNLFRDGAKSLMGPEWQQIGRTFAADLPTALDQGARTMGNIIQGIASIFQASSPTFRDFSTSILNASQRFADWAAALDTNENFQRFMAAIKQDAPRVGALFGAIFRGLTNVGVALAPFGRDVVDKATKFFDWLAVQDPEKIRQVASAITVLGGAWFALAKTLQTFKSIESTLGPLGAFLNPGGVARDAKAGKDSVDGARKGLLARMSGGGAAEAAAVATSAGATQGAMAGIKGMMAGITGQVTKLKGLMGSVKGHVGGIRALIAGMGGPMGALKGSMGTLVGHFKAMGGPLGLVRMGIGGLASGFGSMGGAIAAALGPVGLIVVAIAAIGVALWQTWQHSEAFRNAVTTGWQQLKTTFMELWNGSLKPAFMEIKTVIMRDVWPAFREAFKGIGDTLGMVIPIAVSLIGGLIRLLVTVLTPVVRGLWAFVFKPMLQVLLATMKFVFGTALPAVVRTFIGFFRGAGNVIKSVGSGIVTAWRAMWNTGKALWGAGTAYIKARVDKLGRDISSFITAARQKWDTGMRFLYVVSKNIWKAISDEFSRRLNILKGSIKSSVDGMGKVWGGLRKIFAKPLNAVIDIINDPFLKGLKQFAGKIPGDKFKWVNGISIPRIKEYNRGGVIPGRPAFGYDDRWGTIDGREPIRVGSGEYIVNARATQMARPLLDAINFGNPGRVLGAFRNGGQVPGVRGFDEGGFIDSLKRIGNNFVNGAAGRKATSGGTQRALAFAHRQMVAPTRGWFRRCLEFVNDCWADRVGWTHQYNARTAAAVAARTGNLHQGTPPAGSFVWFNTRGRDGHVALANGAGQVYSNDWGYPKGRISLAPMMEMHRRWGPIMGWFHPEGGKSSGPLDMMANMFGGMVSSMVPGLGPWLGKIVDSTGGDPVGAATKALAGLFDPWKRDTDKAHNNLASDGFSAMFKESNGDLKNAGQTTVQSTFQDIISNIRGAVEGMMGMGDPSRPDQTDPGMSSAPVKPGTARSVVQQLAAQRGWTGAQWNALDWLVSKESSWSVTAKNPRSTAYGLFQFLAGTRRQYGYGNDALSQGRAGLRYIADRYKDPIGAMRFWKAHKWYNKGGLIGKPERFNAGGKVPTFDAGGRLAPGLNLVNNQTGGWETLLRADSYHDRGVRAGSTHNGPLVNVERLDQSDPNEVARELNWEIRKARHAGLYPGY